MTAVRVPWSSASFLVYAGGLTILAATFTLLSTTADEHGAGGFVWWSLLVFIVLSAVAFAASWTGHLVTAGVLALSSVASFVIVLGAVLDWFGWLPDRRPSVQRLSVLAARSRTGDRRRRGHCSS